MQWQGAIVPVTSKNRQVLTDDIAFCFRDFYFECLDFNGFILEEFNSITLTFEDFDFENCNFENCDFENFDFENFDFANFDFEDFKI